MLGGNIRRKVLARVEARIAEGQKEFDEEVVKQDRIYIEGVKALGFVREQAKASKEEDIVNKITA